MTEKPSYEELEERCRELEQAEEKLRVQAAQLRSRNKELNCLFRISEILRRSDGRSLEETLNDIVAFIPPAWQYPDAACARIVIDDRAVGTENFTDTAWTLVSDILVNGGIAGSLTICYLKASPESDEGPFLETERKLSDALAERIGRIVERQRTKEAFQESEEKFPSMVEAFVDPFYISSPDFVVDYMNPAMMRRIGRDATGEKCHQALHGLDANCDWCIFDKIASGESGEIDVKRPRRQDLSYYQHADPQSGWHHFEDDDFPEYHRSPAGDNG